MNRHHPEEAVSQVLGVILMVALAVILAAVTASTVLSMTGDLQTMKFVSVVGEKNDDGTATFTIQGGEDLKTVTGISLVYQDGTAEHLFSASPSAGAVATSTSSVAGQRIVLAASFTDGTQMMILEKQF
ncbi:type IV pilin N-terminal domain-containing protein [Methanofollis tationis]|uniref:Type IV pilin N-terminal domain-containing protein n=1 Tax=Methanofollis tationis TaxID=81417 RepID=A0A7K4HSB8_9EURY|nr:type IV pilin N-terminal domain-containing protein [Methanofollis tationis]NVO67758.1 type IV pilin N-terminal domain-containing protein [Methanofollis tationis]